MIPIKKTIHAFRKDADDIYHPVEIVACCTHDCWLPAQVAMWWTREENYYCPACARGWIKVGQAMGHTQPEATARLMRRDEILIEDDWLLFPETRQYINEKLELHKILWGVPDDGL
jgi:hypothetical protein